METEQEAAHSHHVTAGRVFTEGDELYYEVRGKEHQGKALLMIPGGGGDASWYSLVADILSNEFKVVTYDRRANSRSTANYPRNFEISQQSRDAVAVLRATGEEAAFVLGNSSGAVIALDMAKTQPRAVRAVVAHEPPVVGVHPKARKWQRFHAGTYWMACSLGSTVAVIRFTFGVGLPILELVKAARSADVRGMTRDANRPNAKVASDVLIKEELLPVTNYMPDVESIKKNGVLVFMAAGKASLEKKRYYAQTAPILARKLGCELVIFPGHHLSFFDMPEQWAATLRRVLHKAEGHTGSI